METVKLGNNMAYERLMGLHVKDDEVYSEYRKHMYPLLQKIGGDFGYDFKVSEVLISKTPEPINRVFTIHFKDEESMNTFFNDKAYLKIRETYFDKSVSYVTPIATFTSI